MATYSPYTSDTDLFHAYNSSDSPVLLSTRLLYVNALEFGVTCEDGSKLYVKGDGFVYDNVTGQMTAGTITSVSHYDSIGTFIDGLTDVDPSFDA